jgi:TolC family type I secretion outer membrane protein
MLHYKKSLALLLCAGNLLSPVAQPLCAQEAAAIDADAGLNLVVSAETVEAIEASQQGLGDFGEQAAQQAGWKLLEKALVAAYQNNPELKAQQRQLQATNERVPQALSNALPQLNAAYEDGRQRNRVGGAQWNYSDTKNRTLTLNQPIFRGGRNWFETAAARNEVKAEQARLAQTEQGVLLNTVTAYMDVLRAEAVLRLSENNVSVLKEQLKASRQRFDVGEDTKTDVAQAKARLALAQARVSEAQSNLANAKATFQRLVGYAPDGLKMPGLPKALPQNLEELMAMAKADNPAVQEQEFRKEAADDTIYAQAGTLLPEVSIQGRMNRAEGVGFLGNSTFDEDNLLLTVNFPIFQGGRRYSAVRQAKETYQQQRFLELDVRNRVEEQSASAWEALQAARATTISNSAAIEAAEIALDGVKQEQQYGARTVLDVLDAEQELFDAQVNYVTSQRNYVVAAYQVLTVAGLLTAQGLALNTESFDAEETLSDVEFQFIGF